MSFGPCSECGKPASQATIFGGATFGPWCGSCADSVRRGIGKVLERLLAPEHKPTEERRTMQTATMTIEGRIRAILSAIEDEKSDLPDEQLDEFCERLFAAIKRLYGNGKEAGFIPAAQQMMAALRQLRDTKPEQWDALVSPELCMAWDATTAALKAATGKRG